MTKTIRVNRLEKHHFYRALYAAFGAYNLLLLLTVVFVFISFDLFSSAIDDGLKDLSPFWAYAIRLLPFPLLLLGLYFLGKQKGRPAPVVMETIQPTAAKVLILTLSPPNKPLGSEVSSADFYNNLSLDTPIPEGVGPLKYVFFTEKSADSKSRSFNWEMPIRAIEQHKNSLERVVVITTRGDKGSQSHKATFRKLFEYFIKHWDLNKSIKLEFLDDLVLSDATKEGVDSLDVANLAHAVNQLFSVLEHQKYTNADIVLDVTSGTTLISIALAATSMEVNRRVQYVDTNLPDKVVFLDLNIDKDREMDSHP